MPLFHQFQRAHSSCSGSGQSGWWWECSFKSGDKDCSTDAPLTSFLILNKSLCLSRLIFLICQVRWRLWNRWSLKILPALSFRGNSWAAVEVLPWSLGAETDPECVCVFSACSQHNWGNSTWLLFFWVTSGRNRILHIPLFSNCVWIFK